MTHGTERLAVGSTLTAPLTRPAGLLPASVTRRWWRDALRRRMLAAADLVAGAAAGAFLVVASSTDAATALLAAAALPLWILLAKLHGLYDRDHRALRHLTIDELPQIVLWALLGTASVALVLLLGKADPVRVSAVVQAALVAALAAFAFRFLARMAWRRLTPREQTVIVGEGALADATRRKIELFPDMHLRLSDADLDVHAHDLSALVHVDRIVVASTAIDEQLLDGLLRHCRQQGIKLSVVPPIRGMLGTAVQLTHVAELPVVQFNTWDVPRSTRLLKRTLDVCLATAGLVLFAPLFALIGLAVRLEGPGPILFAQTRAGLGGRPFRMYKFRTMVVDAEAMLRDVMPFERLPEPVFKLRNDPRVTRIGRLLRRSSLDELPQLVNVLKGEMSLVGPRPEQLELVERYSSEERFRLTVKPGLTGPMQVYGRGELTLEERLAVERDYIENLSVRRDLKILALTLATLANGRGAY